MIPSILFVKHLFRCHRFQTHYFYGIDQCLEGPILCKSCLKTRMLVGLYISKRLIPDTNITPSMIEDLPLFLMDTMFQISLGWRVLVSADFTLLFIVLSNLTNEFYWHIIWFKQPLSWTTTLLYVDLQTLKPWTLQCHHLNRLGLSWLHNHYCLEPSPFLFCTSNMRHNYPIFHSKGTGCASCPCFKSCIGWSFMSLILSWRIQVYQED